MPFDCSAVSRAPEFRSEFRDVTNNEWHTTDDMTSCNTCQRRHRSDIVPHSWIAITSWNSGPNSSALETEAQQWGLSPDQHFVWSDFINFFNHTADRHPRSCDIYLFRAFSRIFHKKTHPSMIKSVGDLISTQMNSLRTFCVILEGFARIFLANCCVCLTAECM
jgi:hypothetical protein